MKNKYATLLRTIFISGGATALNYLITFLLIPYITEHVGTEAYGFVTLAKQFMQIAMMITSALNSFAARHIAVEYHRGDRVHANEFYSSTFFGDMLLGGVIGAVFLGLILFLDRIFQVPVDLVGDVKLLFLVIVFDFLVKTVFAVFEVSAHIQNKLDVVGVFQALSTLVEAAVLLLLFRFLPPRVYYVGIGLLCAALVIALGNLWICRRYTPELRIKRSSFSVNAVRQLLTDGVWTSLNSLGDMLNSGLDMMVCNLLLTPLAMGQVAITKTVYAIFLGLFVLVRTAFQPIFLKSYADGDKTVLIGELKFSMKISALLANLLVTGFTALGLTYYQLWLPGQDTRFIYTLTIINNLAMIPGGPMQPLYYIYTLTRKNRVPTVITILGGSLNVLGMFLLIRYGGMGAKAVVWTTVVVMSVINFITNPLYMAHVLGIPKGTFYPVILRNLCSCGAMMLVFRGLTRLCMPHTWLTLILCILGLTAVGAPLHLWIMCDPSDWKRFRQMLRRDKTNEA